MEYLLEVPSASKVVDYFERHDDIYDEYYISFVDFTTIQISFFAELLSEGEKEEHIENIKYIIFNTKIS